MNVHYECRTKRGYFEAPTLDKLRDMMAEHFFKPDIHLSGLPDIEWVSRIINGGESGHYLTASELNRFVTEIESAIREMREDYSYGIVN